MLRSLKQPAHLNRRPKNLEALRRFWGRVPSFWPVNNDVSCSWPLYMYYRSLKSTGQLSCAFDLIHLLRYIRSMEKSSTLRGADWVDYKDDFYRQVLKQVSSYCFTRTFTHGPAYMLFVHLHSLTGKAPYRNEDIENDISNWTSDTNPDGRKKALNKEACARTLDRYFSRWYKGEPNGSLSFKEFCNDFLRWGTAGGARKVEIDGQKYRTKWAWAYKHSTNPDHTLRDDYDLYADAKAGNPGYCNVALKEEAAKTREVITTSMDSYLRQSYLMYRWGKAPFPSPMSDSSWLPKFEETMPKWFGCIDGDKFDQSIPEWFVRDIINRLGGLDESTRTVAEQELLDLDDLKIKWKHKVWDWLGGVLSGWRLTSLMGTAASACAFDYICESSGMLGAFEYGAMGDDLIIYSYAEELSTEELVAHYNSFGLYANIHKTTSGKVGEFLRKVVSMGGSWGYPALGLRSIVYANPWVSTYTYEREAELSSSWLTLISRLLPHSLDCAKLIDDFVPLITTDLRNNFGPGDWEEWIRTPISAGGGGCSEMYNHTPWTRITHRTTSYSQQQDTLAIPILLGIIKSKLIFSKYPDFKPINIRRAYTDAEFLRSETHLDPFPIVKHHINKTKLLFDIIARKLSLRELNFSLTTPIPRALRMAGPTKIVEFLLMGTKDWAGITSISHTKETASIHTSLTKFISRAVWTGRRITSPNILKPAMTFYYLMTYSKHKVPFGTW